MTDIHELLKDHRVGMSHFQHDRFVTGQSGTAYGQYRQALREIDSRLTSLRDFYFKRELHQIDIDETEYKIANAEDKFDRRRKQITLKSLHYGTPDIENAIAGLEDEIMSFYRQAAQLKEHVGELTEEREAELEKEYWQDKTLREAALDLMTQGAYSRSTISMALSYKDDMRDKVLHKLEHEKHSMDQYLKDKTKEQNQLFNGQEEKRLDFRTMLLTEE